MVDRIDPAQEVGEKVAVADVALVEFHLRAEVLWPPAPVYGGGQRVQDDNLMAKRQEPVAGMRAYEAGTSGYEDLHRFRCRLRSPTSRYTSSVAAAVAAQVN